MKANNKIRQLRNDKTGVSTVLGTLMMISIMVPLVSVVALAMGNMTTQFKASFDSAAEAFKVCTENMENVTDYMARFNFRPGGNNGNNSTNPPYVEYEYNATTGQWNFYYCEGHTSHWVKLTPDLGGQQGNLTHQYTLDIIVVGKGSVIKKPQQTSYSSGTSVLLNATGDPGWCFMEWSGDLTGTTNPAAITMNGNRTVYATFDNPLG